MQEKTYPCSEYSLMESSLLQRIQTLSHKKKVIVIAGPTSVGKTEVSLELAAKINGEIISADSMQVYRGMDIGTAKVTLDQQKRIPHYMIDICDISSIYNVKEFYEESQEALLKIFERNKVPIIVGGTGFYIHSLLYGPPSGPGSDRSIRMDLEKKEENFGIDFLYSKLCNYDPEYGATITRHDRHKILRALEIIEISGKKVSDFSWKDRKMVPQYDFKLWFFNMPRALLYTRVENRCDDMILKGFLEEVVALDRKGIRNNSTASQAIGYKEALTFLDTGKSKNDYCEFLERFKISSRHLIKRQVTWFLKEKAFRWLDISTLCLEDILKILYDDYMIH